MVRIPKPSHMVPAKAPVNNSWASLGIVADVLSQFINNCFILVDSKDEIMLTFFTADEINC